MRHPEPVLVLDLFPAERAELLGILAELSAEQWSSPTACAGWSVKDVAAHLIGDDLGRLSRQRDGYRWARPEPDEDLLAFINRQNAEWVQAMRRLSPPVLCRLLGLTGEETQALFASLDPFALGGPVSWAGPEPAPVWLDLAREYTERWHHQQHIRDAVGSPLLTEPHLYRLVLATFVHALPHTLRTFEAAEGSTVHLHISGESGGDWTVRREETSWRLYVGDSSSATARVTISEAHAWRLFTKGLSPAEAKRHARIKGDHRLGEKVLETVAIIA